jgi:hypothetical protein
LATSRPRARRTIGRGLLVAVVAAALLLLLLIVAFGEL